LTEKQKIFANEYLLDLNATRAYKAAYPNIKNDETAAAAAARMLRNVKVAAYIKERMKEREERTEITQDKILRELALIGFSKATDFAKIVEKQAFDNKGQPMEDGEGNPVTYRAVELTLTEDLTEEQQRTIASVKKGRDGLEAKPYDKVRALELLGRHTGMWNDKIDVNGGLDLKVTVDYGEKGS